MKLKPEETNVIEFEISVKGVNRYSLTGYLRITIDGMECGFPAKLDASTIKIEVPPLNSLIKKEFHNGDKFPAKLEIVGDGHYMEPWADDIEIDSKFTIDVVNVKTENAPDSDTLHTMIVHEPKIDVAEPVEERRPTVVDVTEKDLTGEIDEESTERIMRKVLKEDDMSESNMPTSESGTLSGVLMRRLGI